MKIAGIVVTYYPVTDELLRNIASYAGELDCLMIWENTPRGDSRMDMLPDNPKVVVRTTGQNEGIARALNEGARWAIQRQCTHLLSMDQDAFFAPGQFRKFLRLAEAHPEPENAVYAPERNTYDDSLPVKVAETVITSGSLIPVVVFERIGFFMEELFIDMVDHEFCIRARQKGYRILQFPQVCMYHCLGDAKRSKLGYRVNNYSPLRTYYIIRNWHILRRMYPDSFLNTPQESKKFSRRYGWKRFLKIVFFERQKFSKLKAFYLGYHHARQGRLGKFYA